MILSYHIYHVISLQSSRNVFTENRGFGPRPLVVLSLSLSPSSFLSYYSCLFALSLLQSSKTYFTVSFCPHSYSSGSVSPIPFGYAFNWHFPVCIWAKTVAFAFERWRWSDNALVRTFGRALSRSPGCFLWPRSMKLPSGLHYDMLFHFAFHHAPL